MWKSLIPGLCLFLTFGLGDLRGQSEAGGGHPGFHTHLEVQVKLMDPQSNPVNYTEKANGHHIDGLQLEVLQGPHLLFDIDLHLNQGLLPTKYFQKYHHKGQHVIERPAIHQADLCHYQGTLRGTKGYAAISTCKGLIQGVIHDGEDLWHLHPNAQGSFHLYRHSHQKESNLTCGYKDPPRVKRDIAASSDLKNGLKANRGQDEIDLLTTSSLRGPWNANKRSRYVELVLVVDNLEFKEHDSDLDKVYRICKDVANVMNALYSPLNIYIALVGVVVWTEFDEIQLSTDGDTTLKNFLHYRKERLVKDHPNDNAQLLTGIHFEAGVVGKALKGPICTYEFSGGVSMWHSDVVGLVATTVAHEMGHNFGMDHDKEDCECPDEKCIMAPASSTMKPTFWSSCSLEHLALAFEHGMDYCLRNKPEKLFDSPVCGNSFVEQGEECDCGLKDHCDNPCCNPETCQLFANATCATGECCDFSTCQPKTPGNLCRMAEHECDLPEFCDGQNEFCPQDVFKVDGIPCKVGTAFCYGGTCRTHSDQCRLLWGPSGKKSDDQCYEQNKKGTRHGNCGYDRVNNTYVQCEETDVRCGMLHCQHLNERLEFGTESAAILSHSFINSGGRIIPCRTALVDLGLNDVDPGLAPEGARCGEDSLCVNRKCIPVASLVIGPNSCPKNCNGHGMCNSEGNCHCDIGYAPPFCDAPGAGGSIDSGPASEGQTSNWLILLYVLLMMVPMFVIFWVLCQKMPRRSDWRLLVEKAKPRKRLSEVDPASAAAVASEAIAGSKSGTSSPTQALIPHVDTSTSALSAVISASDKEATKSASGGFLNVNFKRPQFMQNLAKSISLPSPKLRAAVKTMATYEIKVEHQVPKEPEEPSLSPSEAPIIESKSSSKDSVTFIKEASKVETTTVEEHNAKQSLITGSKSLTTFSSRPVRSTLTMSTSFRSNSLTSAASASSTTTTSLVSEKKNSLTERIKSLEKATTKKEDQAEVAKTTTVEAIVSSIVSTSLASSTASSSTTKSNTTRNSVQYTTDPKLAFPHSSSFAGRTSAFTIPSLASTSHSANSLKTADEAARKLSKAEIKSVGRSAVAEKSSSPTSSEGSPTKKKQAPPPPPPKPRLKDEAVDSKKKVVEAVVKSPVTTSTSSITLPTSSSAMPLLSKTSTLPWNISSNAASEADQKRPLPKSSTLPLVPSRPVIGRPVLQNATPSAASLISKSHSTGVSQSSILATKEKEASEAKEAVIKPNRASRGVVFCDPLTLPSPTNPNNPPIIHIQPKVTTPPKTSPSSPKKVTSPIVTSAPLASKPSEAKAVVVSSIITPTWTTEPKATISDIVLCHIDDTDSGSDGGKSPTKKSEAVSAPMASPESDKLEAAAAAEKVEKSKTSSLSKLKSKLVKRSSSERKESHRRSSKDGQLDSGLSSPTSSVRSNEAAMPTASAAIPPVRPDRLTKLDISGPILHKSNLDSIKESNLVPVCRSSDATPTEAEPKITLASTTSEAKKSKQPPPITPRKHKSPTRTESGSKKSGAKRPASIATTRPSRPLGPPPRPPPMQKPNVGGSPTRSDSSSLASMESSSSSMIIKPIKPTTAAVTSEATKVKVTSPITSPLSLDDFDTPLTSPIIARRSPDALSTSSSTDGDLMREILKDLDTEVKDEVSTLMRKKKNKNKNLSSINAEHQKS